MCPNMGSAGCKKVSVALLKSAQARMSLCPSKGLSNQKAAQLSAVIRADCIDTNKYSQQRVLASRGVYLTGVQKDEITIQCDGSAYHDGM